MVIDVHVADPFKW